MFKRASSLLRVSVQGTLLALGLALASNTFGIDFDVEVVDQHGAPLSNAVVINPVVAISGAQNTDTHPINPIPAVMDQLNKAFVPLVLAVERGRAVSFPNSDNIRHHVYSFSEAKRFKIKLYANKPKEPLIFDTAGIVVLGCNIHDSMIGYILVSDWRDFSISDSKGLATLSNQSALPDKILVWHPWTTDQQEIQEILIKPEDNKAGADNGKYQITLSITKPKKKAKFKRYRR